MILTFEKIPTPDKIIIEGVEFVACEYGMYAAEAHQISTILLGIRADQFDQEWVDFCVSNDHLELWEKSDAQTAD